MKGLPSTLYVLTRRTTKNNDTHPHDLYKATLYSFAHCSCCFPAITTIYRSASLDSIYLDSPCYHRLSRLITSASFTHESRPWKPPAATPGASQTSTSKLTRSVLPHAYISLTISSGGAESQIEASIGASIIEQLRRYVFSHPIASSPLTTIFLPLNASSKKLKRSMF